jgi:hypothetical protein
MNSGLMSVEVSPGGKALGAALAGEWPQLEVNCGLVTLQAIEVTQHLPTLRALPALHLLQQRVGASPLLLTSSTNSISEEPRLLHQCVKNFILILKKGQLKHLQKT